MRNIPTYLTIFVFDILPITILQWQILCRGNLSNLIHMYTGGIIMACAKTSIWSCSGLIPHNGLRCYGRSTIPTRHLQSESKTRDHKLKSLTGRAPRQAPAVTYDHLVSRKKVVPPSLSSPMAPPNQRKNHSGVFAPYLRLSFGVVFLSAMAYSMVELLSLWCS